MTARPHANHRISSQDDLGRAITSRLNTASQQLPHDVSERLKAARMLALEKRRQAQVRLASAVVASGGSAALQLGDGLRGKWRLLGAWLPLLALVAGLVTIEDVLEQIVGEIEDEHDIEEDSYIKPLPSGDFLIKALTPVENFNEFFDSNFSDDEFDTVGGLVMNAFGHLPKRNEVIAIGDFRFRVLSADSRRVHLLRLTTETG